MEAEPSVTFALHEQQTPPRQEKGTSSPSFSAACKIVSPSVCKLNSTVSPSRIILTVLSPEKSECVFSTANGANKTGVKAHT